MKSKERVFELTNQLKNLFIYKSGLLKYNDKIQLEINNIMDELATITNVFDNSIERETEKIKNELFIIDKLTGERKEPIDIESMSKRVKNINHSNNMFSCLKTLALSNKTVHAYDDENKRFE